MGVQFGFLIVGVLPTKVNEPVAGVSLVSKLTTGMRPVIVTVPRPGTTLLIAGATPTRLKAPAGGVIAKSFLGAAPASAKLPVCVKTPWFCAGP